MGLSHKADVSQTEAESAVKTILKFLGEDLTREGLKDTPARFIQALLEYCSGYGKDPGEILNVSFEETGNYRDIVLVSNVEFTSLCEHHLSPFSGVAHVGYIADKKIIGISKLARLVDVFAQRLQTQERLTWQISNALFSLVNTEGTAVVIVASHTCMCNRGVKKLHSLTTTRNFQGVFRDSLDLRKEFHDLIEITSCGSLKKHPSPPIMAL